MSKMISSSHSTTKRRIKLFPIVAIGASAGGLEAAKEFFKNLPPNTGMGYVYIQHLDPTHESMLTSILSKVTKMKVQEAKNRMPIAINNVYILPPDKEMTIVNGALAIQRRKAKPHRHMPIDFFFTSLAEQQQEGAIGIVLSGADRDGTAGLKAIKMYGGLTMAQNESARFQSMPRSAITEGFVDLVLSPAEMGHELERISKQTTLLREAITEDVEDSVFKNEDITNILQLIKKSTGADFTHYKRNTIKRRIVRRLLLYRLNDVKDYTKYLQQHANEINVLYQDLLINVTAFFRDATTMEYLRKSLLPRIIKSKTTGEPIRIWIPACSTGEEVYSIAILLMEVLGDKAIPIQIFATDLSEQAIAKARQGVFSKNDLQNISEKRLQRFFTKIDSGYRIIKPIREICIFAPHNVFKDPPFSRIDLISCCNLLIYLDPILQKKLITTFHYALQNKGYLLLGKSETIGPSTHLFTQPDKKYKIYERKPGNGSRLMLDINYRIAEPEPARASRLRKYPEKETNKTVELDKEIENILIHRYMPPCVVVNQDMEVLQFKGSTGLFLEHSSGRASLNLLKMARTELTFELRSAIHKAAKLGKPVKKNGLEIKNKEITHLVSIEVLPLNADGPDKLFLVVFEAITGAVALEKSAAFSRDRTVKKLQNELTTLREDIRSFVAEQEASHEELQNANEEIVSSNEELQSINEELETSKEEIESANEELMTINEELLVRNEQLAEAYEYAEAFFYTIREAILVLDRELRVKTANPAFYNIFKVNKEDVEGRFIYELGDRQWDIPQLRNLLENIIPRSSQFNSYEVMHDFPEIGKKTMLLNGRRIFQKNNRQQLILLAIEDITEHKQMQQELEKLVEKRTADLQQTNRELERSNGELKQFAYVASHDLQEPLRKIMTFSDRLQLQFSNQLPEKGKGYIEKITRSTQRMNKLINDLLDFSKASPKNGTFKKTDLNIIIKNVMSDFEEIIKEKQATIKIKPLPVIQAIPVQMEQLFHNLISNALKFTDKKRKPVISITTLPFNKNQIRRFPRLNPNTAHCEIIVQDNGIGFNAAYSEQIFVIFQRLDDNQEFPGTGIGLALCRKIMDNHDGEIYAKSEENKGAAFHIILPVLLPVKQDQ